MASLDFCTNQDNSDENINPESIELEVFLESNKLYIRSKMNDIPVFEIEGDYTDPIIEGIIQAIQTGTLNDKILELLDGFSAIANISCVKCTVNDDRPNQNHVTTLYLHRNQIQENVFRSVISVASPCLILNNSNNTKLCY